METSVQVLASLAAFIFYASLKTTVLVALILLAQKVLGRFLSANGRYLLWLAVVISLVTPIGYDTTLPAFVTSEAMQATPANTPAPLTQPVIETNSVEAEVANTGITRSALNPDSLLSTAYTADASIAPSVPWVALLPYLWLTGALLVLGLVAVASYRFSVLVQRATPGAKSLQNLLQGCLEQTACKARVRLLHSADIQGPMVAGMFKPALLLPEGIESRLTQDQLRYVFIHELMHLKRRDIVSNWIVVLLQALHWFNPAIWLAFSFMRQDRELACDAATLRHLDPDSRLAYGHTLLQLSETIPRNPVPAHVLGIVGSPSQLRRRILMLVQASRSGRFQSAVATLLFVPLAAVAFSQPAPAILPAEPAAPGAVAAAPVQAVAAPAEPAANAARPVTRATPAAASETAPQAPDADNPIPVIQQIPVEEARPVVRAVIVSKPAVSAAPVLAQINTPPVVDPFESDTSASSVVIAAIIASQQPEPPAEPYTDLAAVQELADEISAIKSEKISFIENWDSIAADCEARSHRPFGNLIKPCRQMRFALRTREILDFGIECYNLASRHTELLNRYRDAGSQQNPELVAIGSALQGNEQNLREFCSAETYEASYPAFAVLFEEAQSPEYVNDRRMDANPRLWGWSDSNYQMTLPVVDHSRPPSW